MKIILSFFAIFLSLSFSSQIANSSISYFGDGILFNQGFSLISTADDGHILLGAKGVGTLGSFPITDQWLIKLDQNQEVVWEYTMDYSSFIIDYGLDAVEVSDGYIILGTFFDEPNFEYFSNIEKLDHDGNLIWSIVLDNSIFDGTKYCTIFPLDNDGFIIGGYVDTISGSSFSLSEYDADGNLIWVESYPDIGSSNIGIYSYGDLKRTSEGDFLLAGELENAPALAKISSSGELLWNMELSVPGGVVAMDVLANDDILVLTTESVYSNPSQDFLVHLDSEGNMIGSFQFDYDMVNAVVDFVVDESENVFVVGNDQANDEVVLLKTDPDGLVIDWVVSFAGDLDLEGLAVDQLVLTDENHLAFAGSGLIPTTSPDILMVGYMSITYIELEAASSVSDLEHTNTVVTFPNPAQEKVHFQVSGNHHQALSVNIFNAVGSLVSQETFASESFTWERGNLANGAYTYSIYSSDHELIALGKLILH